MRKRLEWTEEQKLIKDKPLPNVETTFGIIDLPLELEQKNQPVDKKEKSHIRNIFKIAKKRRK